MKKNKLNTQQGKIAPSWISKHETESSIWEKKTPQNTKQKWE